MDQNVLTREEAYSIIGKRLVRELRNERPEGIYMTSKDDDQVWYAHLNNPGQIGASRVIAISKITGEILADQMIGK